MGSERAIQICVAALLRVAERQAAQRQRDMAEEQRVLRERYDEVLASTTVEEFEARYQGFVQRYGRDVWDRQAGLGFRRFIKEGTKVL